MQDIAIQEGEIEQVVEVNKTITEFEEYSKEYFEKRCKDKDRLVLLAHYNNSPAGYMISYDRFNDKSLYCWMTGVNPAMRRKGVLKAMMQYTQKWAKKKGFSKIRIKTRNNRREMIAYLVKEGFNFTKVEQKENIEENRILLEKDI